MWTILKSNRAQQQYCNTVFLCPSGTVELYVSFPSPLLTAAPTAVCSNAKNPSLKYVKVYAMHRLFIDVRICTKIETATRTSRTSIRFTDSWWGMSRKFPEKETGHVRKLHKHVKEAPRRSTDIFRKCRGCSRTFPELDGPSRALKRCRKSNILEIKMFNTIFPPKSLFPYFSPSGILRPYRPLWRA